MKLFISGASTIPVVTPVATATTLPPSITALQQQGLLCFDLYCYVASVKQVKGI